MESHLNKAATEGLCSCLCARNPAVRVELLLKEPNRWVTFLKNHLVVAAAPAATAGQSVSSLRFT